MRFGLLFFVLLVGITVVAMAAPAPTAPPSATVAAKKSKGKGKLGSSDTKDKLMTNCQKKKNKCKGQTDEYKQSRKEIKASLIEDLKAENDNITDQQADQKVEKRLNKIYNLKKKIHEKFNLTDIDPADDGLWQGDIVLSDEQADIISQNLDNPRPVFKSPAEKMQVQKRSASLYFEVEPKLKWKMPIHYWVSNDFTKKEKSTIDDALNNITQATGCIKFTKDSKRLTSGVQIQYVKSRTSGCNGNSPIGLGLNQIQMATTDWCQGTVLKGLIMHETIHSLGGDHEQSRADRDDYIEILFDNIDPQKASNYEKDTWTTSYGVQYDYQSIMHYDQGTFQVSPGLDTMEPVNAKGNIKLGSDILSTNDINQLKRMYCKAASCLDTDQDCGTWAIEKWCTVPDWVSWMKKNCPRSCGVC